jgi:hypothetical protein
VLSSFPAYPPLLGAQARLQLNKMWQETMNQGGEGRREAELASGPKSLSLCFQACSGLSSLRLVAFPQQCLPNCTGSWVTARTKDGIKSEFQHKDLLLWGQVLFL